MPLFYPIAREPYYDNYWEDFETALDADYYKRFSLLLGFYHLLFLICPRLLRAFVRPLKNAPKDKVNSFCTDVVSVVNSSAVSVITVYSLIFNFPQGNYQGMFYAFRWCNCSIGAYLLADTVFRIVAQLKRNLIFMVIHHLVGVGLSQSSHYDGNWLTPKHVFCLMELANPYISCRFMCLSLKYSKKSLVYKIVSTGMFYSFLITRVIPIPWMLYWQLELLWNDPKSQTIYHASSTFFYVLVSLMNCFWFKKMIIGYKAMLKNKDHVDL